MKKILKIPVLLLSFLFLAISCNSSDDEGSSSGNYNIGDEFTEFTVGGEYTGSFNNGFSSFSYIDQLDRENPSYTLFMDMIDFTNNARTSNLSFSYSQDSKFDAFQVLETKTYSFNHDGGIPSEDERFDRFRASFAISVESQNIDHFTEYVTSGSITFTELSRDWIRGEFSVTYKIEENNNEVTVNGTFLSRNVDSYFN